MQKVDGDFPSFVVDFLFYTHECGIVVEIRNFIKHYFRLMSSEYIKIFQD